MEVESAAGTAQQQEGQEEDYDLYGDLNALQSDINNQRMLQMYEAATKENEALKTEREELLQQVQFLRDQKKTLESNVLSVFNTGTTEIERKNKMISNLQQELARIRAERASR